jgi:septal ring factor EnvC (AmiA/AmiB activator)
MTQQLEDLQAKLEQMRQVYEEEKTKRLRIEKKFKTLEKKYRQLERSIRVCFP